MDLNAFACELNFILTIEMSLTFFGDGAGNWDVCLMASTQPQHTSWACEWVKQALELTEH